MPMAPMPSKAAKRNDEERDMVRGVGDVCRLRPEASSGVTKPAATCDQISLLLLLAALGQPEALSQCLLLLGLLGARLLRLRHEGLPAGAHGRRTRGFAQATLGLLQLLEAFSAARFLHAAQALEIVRALGWGEPTEGIHHGAASRAFLGLAEP